MPTPPTVTSEKKSRVSFDRANILVCSVGVFAPRSFFFCVMYNRGMNETIFYFFYSFAHQSFFTDKLIVFFAVYFPYVVIFLTGCFLLFQYRKNLIELRFFDRSMWKEVVIVSITPVLARFMALQLKDFFHTARPFDLLSGISSVFSETGYAFPSGHATTFAALAFAIFFFHKKVGYIFMFFALLIGLARIIAGVHFPIDILGGFILGGIVSSLVAYFGKNV